MIDFDLHVGADGSDLCMRTDARLLTVIVRWLDEIERRHGPDRSIGPVTFEVVGECQWVRIETQKQGEYVLSYDEDCCSWVVVAGPYGRETMLPPEDDR